ncbi:MAG TPA: RnfABCDGE type electron transport complex subunit D [Acetivibrio sp.]|nr:RnfABCDGE type electron transport complex subunit D [Acetivibrio sp.]
MGIGCGVITAVIRLLTENTEGVSYAIMIMNILVPLIDRYTVPRSFGGGKYNA